MIILPHELFFWLTAAAPSSVAWSMFSATFTVAPGA